MSFASECVSNFTEIITKKYCLFSGRARRREYWMFVLANFVIGVIASVIDNVFGLEIENGANDIEILSTIVSLALLLPSLGLTVRRLHDIGRDWYWIFIALIPIAGPIWLLVLECREGDRFDNAFGPDPKAGPVFVPGDNRPVV
ncbi:MAG: DUF805 domain-containing protein [Abditibacteriota bacterium]|nr:DUF805 domain-containing protein [Abditibacteriota bacterium]